MKSIKLIMPRVIAGIVRHPAEGVIVVEDEIADGLVEDHAAEFVADEELGSGEFEDDGLDDKKVDDLKKIAADEQVDLGEATKKADIIAAIRAHRAAE